jgi:hypothetical protein
MEPGEATDALIMQMRQAGKEQRKQLKEQKRQEALAKSQAALAARGNRAAAGAAGAMGDADIMAGDGDMGPGGPGGFRRPFVPTPAPQLPTIPGARRPAVAPGGVVRPGVRAPVQIAPVVLGSGKFPVQEGMGNIRIIAHDDTVEPGKTYRYKLRYKLFNPVYKGNAAPPELTKSFALPSTDSAWTAKFTVRPKVEFFLASTTRSGASFDTFTFKDGQTRKRTLNSIGPGDVIEGTGWALVDTGGSGDKAYALLMDDNGQVFRREAKADKETDRYGELNDLAAQPAVGLGQ